MYGLKFWGCEDYLLPNGNSSRYPTFPFDSFSQAIEFAQKYVVPGTRMEMWQRKDITESAIDWGYIEIGVKEAVPILPPKSTEGHEAPERYQHPMRLILPDGRSAEVTNILTGPGFLEVLTKDPQIYFQLEGLDKVGLDPQQVIGPEGIREE